MISLWDFSIALLGEGDSLIIDTAELEKRYLLRIAGARDKKVYIGPQVVALDISNLCNLRCRYCSANHAPKNPHHFEEAHFFPWERFLEVIDDCVDLNVDHVSLVGDGEPAVHPLFRDMMRHLEQKPLKVMLLTNATFPLEYCSDVIKGDHVIINLSAVDRQAYRELHGQDLFERVIANIKRLVSLRNAGKPGFIIEISYIVNALNIKQKQKMQELAFQLGLNGVCFEEMTVHAYNREIALPQGPLSDSEGKEKRTPPVCLNGWFFIRIRSDGTVSTCSPIRQGRTGDLNKMSLKQIWLSPQMMNMRLLGKIRPDSKDVRGLSDLPFL